MSSHSVCYYKQIRERTYRLICHIDIILIHLTFSTHISLRIYLHLVSPLLQHHIVF